MSILYKVYKSSSGNISSVIRDNNDGTKTTIPFDPDNTDYQTFKSQINADEAELQDADGVLMSPEEAQAFVATLP